MLDLEILNQEIKKAENGYPDTFLNIDLDDVTERGYTALAYCIYKNKVKAFDRLLTLKKDIPESEKQLCLISAVRKSTTYFTQRILSLGFEHVNFTLNQNKVTPLITAAQNSHHHQVKLLCEQGADVDLLDCKSRSAASIAINKRDKSVLKELLKYNASIEPHQQGWIDEVISLVEKEKLQALIFDEEDSISQSL